MPARHSQDGDERPSDVRENGDWDAGLLRGSLGVFAV